MKEYEVRTVNLFKALSNPVRYMILKLLNEHAELRTGDLSRILDRDKARISSHLKILKDVQLVRFRTEESNVYYRLKKSSVLDLISKAETMVRR